MTSGRFADGSSFWGTNPGGGNPAMVTTSLASYNVTWCFAGSESGFTNSFSAPGISTFSEADQNNNLGGPSGPGPILLGTGYSSKRARSKLHSDVPITEVVSGVAVWCRMVLEIPLRELGFRA